MLKEILGKKQGTYGGRAGGQADAPELTPCFELQTDNPCILVFPGPREPKGVMAIRTVVSPKGRVTGSALVRLSPKAGFGL